MQHVPRPVFACFALFVACWTLPSGAQPAHEDAGTGGVAASAEAASPSDVTEALRQAVAAYEQGDLVSARRLFELVHAAAPTARTLRSLGLVAFRQERYADAAELLQASLANQQKPLTDAQREGVANVLATARAHLTDDEGAAPLAAPSPAQTETRSPSVPVATAQPARQPSSAQRSEAKRAVASVPRQGARVTRLKRAAYALLGIALASVVVSATSYAVGVSRLRNIERACRRRPEGGCEPEYARQREREERLDMLGKLSLASGILGGVSAGGGGALLIWQWRREIPSVGHATIGLGWRGHF